MPSFNLPQFTSTAPSTPPPIPPPRRPILSIIQPPPLSSSSRHGRYEVSTITKKPLPPAPSPSPKRAHTCPPAYLSSISSSSFSSSSSSSPPPQTGATQRNNNRRIKKPLSKRYTTKLTTTSSSNRSTLQSHSIPSFTNTIYSIDNDSSSLFEELLTRNLERKLREKLGVQSSSSSNQQKKIKARDKVLSNTGGGLKPGRELFIWSIVNRITTSQRTSNFNNTRKIYRMGNWEESGLNGRNGGRAMKGKCEEQEGGKGGGHRRSQSLPLMNLETPEDEDDDEDDDEPLARKLQQAIEKREKQLIEIQTERIKKKKQQQQPQTVNTVETKPVMMMIDVQVKIKLPTCPKPVLLKPLLSSSISTSTSHSRLPLSESSNTLSNRFKEEVERREKDIKRSKRLKRTQTSPSSGNRHSTSPGGGGCLSRSLSLPTLPPRIAILSSSSSSTSTSKSTSLDVFHSQSSFLPPPLSVSVCPSFSPSSPSILLLNRRSKSESTARGGGERTRKISTGMKRTRS